MYILTYVYPTHDKLLSGFVLTIQLSIDVHLSL